MAVLQTAVLAGAALSSTACAQDARAGVKADAAPAAAPAPNASASNRVAAKKEKEVDVSGGWLPPGEDPQNRLFLPVLKHMLGDQRAFWSLPLHLRSQDLPWLAPAAAFTAGVVASDSWISKQVPQSASRIQQSKDASNYAVFSLIGVAGGSYFLGAVTHNDHLEESGLLGGEAAVGSTAAAYIFKEIAQRPRPYQGNGHGTFFQGGTSFPSEHAAVAWAAASVLAHEYPGKLSQILAYGAASAVTISRITAKQHFASDALVGSALGWYFGRQVYRAHHDPELGGSAWGGLLPDNTGEKTRNPANMGSPEVPLDSWVYPALERLQALGYIDSAYLGMRPWTRLQCARLVEEAGDNLVSREVSNETAAPILSALQDEFSPENSRLEGAANLDVSLDSVYARAASISGKPLTDGYHFGQTEIDDFGRPYGQGFNSVDGITAHADAGPFAFYMRGEYQHAPALASDSPAVLQAIAQADLTAPAPNGRGQVDRFRLLDSAVAVTFHNVQMSIGKQSQWLGPGDSQSLLLSDNAEPVTMLKVRTVSPVRIPGLSRLLGPVQTEYFLGQLSGQEFEFDDPTLLGPGGIHPQPFLDGSKISFKPMANLEIGMGFTAQFAGPGLPFTWANFLRTFYSHTSGSTAGSGGNPGKRLSSADISYRVADGITFYLDSLVVDEFSPIGSTRASVSPGIYIPRLPRLSRLDFRAETVREPLTSEFAPGFVYYGVRRFRSGYTNDGNLLGSWIGRAGEGGQGWVTYWLSARSRLQFGYRQQEVSRNFLGGGRLSDTSVAADLMLSQCFSLSGTLQYERWKFPLLAADPQSNVTASLQVNFFPKWRIR